MAEAKNAGGYDANQMSYLSGLDAVKKRPGMYIGSTDSAGVQHLVFEILDNSVDEGLAGHASHIDVTFHADGSVQVDDDGRGIPTDVNTKTGLSGVELALTKLHAGGKFGGSGYKSAGGLHGVGSSVVNALSSRLDASVYRGGKCHDVSFRGGMTGVFNGDGPDADFKAKPGLRVSADKRPAAAKKTRPSGTSIRWWHDKNIFLPGSQVDVEGIKERARTTAFLVPQLSVAVHDNRVPGSETSETFKFEGGIADMAEFLAPDQDVAAPLYIQRTDTFEEVVPVLQEDGTMASSPVQREVDIKIAFRWGTGYDTILKSYVNVVNTPEGGTHIKGFERGLLKAIQNGIKTRKGIVKANEPAVILEDALEGITAVVSVGFAEPQFEGQTKGKLGTNAITRLVQNAVSEELTSWMDTRKNTKEAKTILEKVAGAMRVRVAQREQKQLARRKTSLESASMPSKLVDCAETSTEFAELHICEGDSALGTMREARDERYQALFPIRGKILNTHRATPAKMLDNAECAAIIQVLGAGSGRNFDIDQMRYKNICIAVDADLDGNHIRCLLIVFVMRYMRPVIEAGRLYATVPPLYVLKATGRNKQIHYLSSDEEKDALLKKLDATGVKHEPLQRLKGLGEMDAEEFWDTTLNPETRKLRRVTLNDVKAAEDMLELTMGGDASARKEWMENMAQVVRMDNDLE